MPSNWCAVYTRPGAESRAAFHLKRQGFEAYAPGLRKTVRHSRQSKSIIAPFFPRYIFILLDSDRDRWRSINGTLGVAYLLTANDRPLHVPEGFVENLMNFLNGNGQTDIENRFQINDNVQFVDGPFSELIGQVQNFDSKGRVKVLLELMGRPVSVKAHHSSLAAII